MQAEYEHSILNVFQVMITNSRADTRVDVSEQTNGQTNVQKLAHLYGAAEADATKTNYFSPVRYALQTVELNTERQHYKLV